MAPSLLAVGGLLVWAVHFFGLYLIASAWPTADAARLLAAAFTIACLTADGWFLARARAAGRAAGGDSVDCWLLQLGFLGAALSAVAVLWQGIPALLV